MTSWSYGEPPASGTGVTNGDSHNHLGGDGGTIAHTSLGTVGANDHHAQAHTHAWPADRELNISLDALGRGATAPALVRLGSYAGYEYDIDDDSHFSFEVPSDWGGGDIDIAFHWYCNEAYALNSGKVRWKAVVACTPEGGGEALDAPTHTETAYTADTNIPATAKYLIESEIEIPAAKLAAHDVVGVLFSRCALAGVASPPTAKPTIVGLEIEYAPVNPAIT